MIAVANKFQISNGLLPAKEDLIPRIAEEISYINEPAGDIPNVQIDGWRTASSEPILVKDGMEITFHSKSFDGETWDSDAYAENTIIINKTDNFEGWNAWKEANRNGLDCTVLVQRVGKRITLTTENAGIFIKCITVLKDNQSDVYLALTGDQCALTNIRISK